MYGCKSWTIKKAQCQRLDAFKLWCWRRLLKSPFDCMEIKPINPKGNQPWIFIGKTDTEAEAPILWPHDVKDQLIGNDPDAWKDWEQEEKRATENEMFEWHHWLNGHEFEQIPGNSKRQENWHAAVHGFAKSQTWLHDWTTTKLSPCKLTPLHPCILNCDAL